MHLIKNLQMSNKYKNKIDVFYKFITNNKKKNDKKKFNEQISNIQNTIIGLSRGFKRKIRLKGIGYKFIFNKNILTFQIVFTHSFSVTISSLLYCRMNKKRTKLLLKYNDYNKLTLFLSAFQNIKKPNIYTGKGIRYNLKKFYQKEGKKKKF
jgi:large subunit ribosomal protein L6